MDQKTWELRQRNLQKQAIAKRLADAAEKMGVAGMALGAYQGNVLAGLLGLGVFLSSIFLTWRFAARWDS
jgi:hypothetical protein